MANSSYSIKRLAKIRDLYPFGLHWFDLKGLRYHYVDEGASDSPVIVMIHGNPTWSFYYRTLIKELSKTHRVIVPDHIGMGLSDKPQTYEYTLERHIQNLESLLVALKLKDITMIVHDWGGAIGAGYAVRHPETITRMVVLNTSAFYKPMIHFSLLLARLPLFGEILLLGMNGFALTALMAAVTRPLPRLVKLGYVTPYNNWRNRIGILRFVRDIPWERDHPTRRTLDAIDDKLHLLANKPMLICWGAKDFVFTVDTFLDGWRERFPKAEVHVFEDAGHYVLEDASERIMPLIQKFLQESPHKRAGKKK